MAVIHTHLLVLLLVLILLLLHLLHLPLLPVDLHYTGQWEYQEGLKFVG